MIIKIDNREADLVRCCNYIISISPAYKDITIVVENLPIGDIILMKDDKEKVIVERKSIRDLAASIKDGRYEEQSYRLNGLPIHNHNIIYLIEGDMNKFNVFKDRTEKLTLYSSMVSLNHFKGFSIMRSLTIEESALIICNMAYKINKSEMDGKMPFFKNTGVSETPASLSQQSKQELTTQLEDKEEKYCSVVKRVKKENITPENIGEIMLCQIPGVSSTTAIAIMTQFKSISNLLCKLNENSNCLQNISYANSKGQTRKISKPAINNILSYLHTTPHV